MKFEVELGKKENGSLVLFGVGVLVSYYNLIDRVNLRLNYMGDNRFVFKMFSSTSLEMSYTPKSSIEVGEKMNVVNLGGENSIDCPHAMMKTLTAYDVITSSLV